MLEVIPPLPIFIPFIAAFLVLVVPKRAKGWFAIAIAIATTALIFLMAPTVIFDAPILYEIPWIPTFGWNFTLLIDGLSLMIALIAAGIGALIIFYSRVYLSEGNREHPYKHGFGRYYMFMLIFMGGMIGLVFASNLIILFLFWELIGLCSWALIGFNAEDPKASRASIKALITTHVGGACLLFGILLLYLITGTFDISQIPGRIGSVTPLLHLALAMFILGALAKSAQVPFLTWLPAAMEAPSPVSAYLHAATMVKAGVYLIARVTGIFWVVFLSIPAWDFSLATVGVVTLTIGALFMLVQKDLKKLLAFSTISQIGYMILAIGIGTSLGVTAGLFHLLNHAIFKALLFLCAGMIAYQVGTRNIDQMGGLAKNMPITASVFVIGALAVAGVPPLNGFASKWMIYQAAIEAGAINPIYYFYAIIAIFISAVTLAVFIKVLHGIFFGQLPERLKNIKEGSRFMWAPLVILAAFCIVFGIAAQWPLEFIVAPAVNSLPAVSVSVGTVPATIFTNIGLWGPTLATVLLLSALFMGALIYWAGFTIKNPPVERLDTWACGEDWKVKDLQVLSEQFYHPIRDVMAPIYKVDFDRILHHPVRNAVYSFSNWFRKSHTGLLQLYMLWMAVGALAVIIILALV
ncbi:MAG: NADH-quinone oxidoreductase subunit L [Candidatus Bathyarchaeota archaeon]